MTTIQGRTKPVPKIPTSRRFLDLDDFIDLELHQLIGGCIGSGHGLMRQGQKVIFKKGQRTYYLSGTSATIPNGKRTSDGA